MKTRKDLAGAYNTGNSIADMAVDPVNIRRPIPSLPTPTPTPTPTPATTMASSAPATTMASSAPAVTGSGMNRSDAQARLNELSARLQRLKSQALKSDVEPTAVSSDNIRNQENKIRGIVSNLSTQNAGAMDAVSNLDNVNERNNAILDRYSRQLQQLRQEEVGNINQQFDQQRRQTEKSQEGESMQTSVALARTGGYLGGSASSIGAMANLNREQEFALERIETQRAQAIREANEAVINKDFQVAQEKVQLARQLAKDKIAVQDNYFQQQLDLAREDRLQEKQDKDFAIEDADRQLSLIAESGEQASPEVIQNLAESMGVSPRILDRALQAKQASLEIERQARRGEVDMDLMSFLLNIPKGTYVEIGGQTYEGLKPVRVVSGGSTSSSAANGKDISRTFADKYGLPRTLIGADEGLVIESMYSSSPPSWYIEQNLRQKGVNILGVPDNIINNAVDMYFESSGSDSMQLVVVGQNGVESQISNEKVYDFINEWDKARTNFLYGENTFGTEEGENDNDGEDEYSSAAADLGFVDIPE